MGFQRGEDFLLDVQVKPFKFLEDEFSGCWPRLRERDVDGDVGVELRLGLRSGHANQHSCNVGMVIERAYSDFRRKADDFTVLRLGEQGDLLCDFSVAREYQVSVFVHVAQLIEHPKRMLARFVPRKVRLHSLDDALNVGTHLRDRARASTLFGKRAAVDVERKVHKVHIKRSTSGARMGRGEPVCKMVEGGSHVVDRVTDDERQDDGKLETLLEMEDNKDCLCRTLVLLSDLVIRIRVEERLNPRLQRYEVFPCAL